MQNNHGGRQYQSDGGDGQDHGHGGGRGRKEREDPGHEVDAGGHHGRGMEQGRNRGGTFHGVGQPHMQRELGAFAHDAAEDQQARGGEEPGRHGLGHRGGVHRGDIQAAVEYDQED